MRIAICDSRNDVACLMKYLLQNICRKEKVAAHIDLFSTTDELCDVFQTNNYAFELVLLYTGTDGTKCAEHLRNLNNSFRLVFLTSYDVTDIYDLFQYNISSIIPKFMSEKYVIREFTRIVRDIEHYKYKYLTFEIKISENSFAEKKIQISDILYMTVLDRKVYIKTLEDMYTLKCRNFALLKNLMFGYNFIEINRFYIVNMETVQFIKGNEIILDNGTKLKISRRHLKSVTNTFSDIFDVSLLRKNA